MDFPLLPVVLAYLLGSVPSAVLISRWLIGRDIRTLGDGNMGARNVTRSLGVTPGVVVAVLDAGKAALAVMLARWFGARLEWQYAAGVAAVVGHDFPVWVGFRGGQGMASSLGALLVLLPVPSVIGSAAFGSIYLVTRSFDLGAACGLALILLLAWSAGQPTWALGVVAVLFVSIGLKKALDAPRRRALTQG